MASGTIKSVVPRSDIVNNLTTNDSTKVLSAAQGKALKDNTDAIIINLPDSSTLSTIYTKLNNIPVGITATIWASSSAMNILTGGSLTGDSFKGVASRHASSTWDFTGLKGSGQNGHSLNFRVESLTSSSAGNCYVKDDIATLSGKTIQNTESFSSLSTFKTFLANMTVGKAVDIITSSEVSTAIAGSTYICSGIATKIDSSFVDISWVRGDSAVGSTRYKISSQTFTINDLNSNITNLVTGYTSYTPEITSSENTGFAVNSISFVYARTGKLMFINGRFNITNAGSDAANSSIYISLPSGYTCSDITGACGYITLDRAGVDISNISIRQMSNKMWVQKGAGGGKSLGVIGTGYVMVSATIILN